MGCVWVENVITHLSDKSLLHKLTSINFTMKSIKTSYSNTNKKPYLTRWDCLHGPHDGIWLIQKTKFSEILFTMRSLLTIFPNVILGLLLPFFNKTNNVVIYPSYWCFEWIFLCVQTTLTECKMGEGYNMSHFHKLNQIFAQVLV